MKKFLSLVVAALLSASAVATNVSAAKFTDVDVNNDALNDAVELLTALNVTKGTTDTTFGTEENVTRQQMAAFIYRMMKAGKSVEGGVNTTSFTDLDDSTYYFMVSWANSMGIIKGRSATTFDPKGGITLQDAYTMVVRALGYDDGTLSYPIGYISKAEDLGLDEDLPSALNYTDTLKRGDVAIILANMFYAETAEVEIKYVGTYKFVCPVAGHDDPETDCTTSCNPQPVSTGQVPKEYQKTVAEAIFDVKQIRQRVVATTNYAISLDGKDIQPLEADVPMVQLTYTDVDDYTDYFEADEKIIPSLGQKELSELGLEGSADDYFLNDIVMFVREVDGEYEVFGATAIGTKETVSYDKVELGTVSGSSEEKYYDGENKQYKKISGKLTLDDTVTYLYNAPYSFTKSATKDKYAPEFIELKKFEGDMEEEQPWMIYGIKNVLPVDPDEDKQTAARQALVGTYYPAVGDESDPAYQPAYWDYDEYFSLMYFGGLGEIDVYDCDNDGKPDYLFKKDFTTGVIDIEEELNLADNAGTYDGTAKVTTDEAKIYTDMSIVEGVEFEDEDIVLAYVNADANYVKVVEVLTGKDATLATKTDKYVVLSTGEKIYLENKNAVVLNAEDNLAQLANASFDKEDTYYFTADGKLVYADVVNAGINVDEDYVVVLSAKTQSSSAMIDGKFESDEYVKIYHDGEVTYVKAKKIDSNTGKLQDSDTPQTYFVDSTTKEGYFDYTAYVNKLATAKSDKNGNWYFNIVDMTKYSDPTADLAKLAESLKDNKKADEAEFRRKFTLTDTTDFYNKTGYLYNLSDITNLSNNVIKGVYVKPYTQIIIKSIDKEGNEVTELYGYENLPDIDKNTKFETVSYVLVNNVNSRMYENLAVFYGVINGQLEPDKGEVADVRVVKQYSMYTTDEGTLYSYDVYNPFTGKVDEGIESVEIDDTFKFNPGDIVGLTTEGYINNELQYAAGNVYNPGKLYNVDLSKVSFDDYGSTGYTETVNGATSIVKLGYVEVANYDEVTKLLELNLPTTDVHSGAMFQLTDATVVTFNDKSERSFKAVDADVLASETKTYRDTHEDATTGKTVIEPMKVFLCVEENEENVRAQNKGTADFALYDVKFAMIVRK